MRSKPDEHLHACLTWNKLTVRYVSPKSNAGFTMNGGRKQYIGMKPIQVVKAIRVIWSIRIQIHRKLRLMLNTQMKIQMANAMFVSWILKHLNSLESYLKELSEDLTGLLPYMIPEERQMAKTRITTLAAKM